MMSVSGLEVLIEVVHSTVDARISFFASSLSKPGVFKAMWQAILPKMSGSERLWTLASTPSTLLSRVDPQRPVLCRNNERSSGVLGSYRGTQIIGAEHHRQSHIHARTHSAARSSTSAYGTMKTRWARHRWAWYTKGRVDDAMSWYGAKTNTTPWRSGSMAYGVIASRCVCEKETRFIFEKINSGQAKEP